jgi:hypothetical protein
MGRPRVAQTERHRNKSKTKKSPQPAHEWAGGDGRSALITSNPLSPIAPLHDIY